MANWELTDICFRRDKSSSTFNAGTIAYIQIDVYGDAQEWLEKNIQALQTLGARSIYIKGKSKSPEIHIKCSEDRVYREEKRALDSLIDCMSVQVAPAFDLTI